MTERDVFRAGVRLVGLLGLIYCAWRLVRMGALLVGASALQTLGTAPGHAGPMSFAQPLGGTLILQLIALVAVALLSVWFLRGAAALVEFAFDGELPVSANEDRQLDLPKMTSTK